MGITTMTVAAAQKFLAFGSPVLAFLTDAGRVYICGFTPPTFQIGGNSWSWTSVPRQGRVPLLFAGAPQAQTVAFTNTLPPVTTSRDRVPVSYRLDALLALAAIPNRVRLIHGPSQLSGWWYVQDCSATITDLTSMQQARSADVSWTLVRQVDQSRPKVSRTPPPAKAKPKPTKAAAPVKSPAPRRYTVRSGDTLWKIAGALLGDFSRWKDIAKLNKLADPNRLKVGQVLLIPATAGAKPPSSVVRSKSS